MVHLPPGADYQSDPPEQKDGGSGKGILFDLLTALVVVGLPIAFLVVLGVPQLGLPTGWPEVETLVNDGTLPGGFILNLIVLVLALAWVGALALLADSVAPRTREGKPSRPTKTRRPDKEPRRRGRPQAEAEAEEPWYRQSAPLFSEPIVDIERIEPQSDAELVAGQTPDPSGTAEPYGGYALAEPMGPDAGQPMQPMGPSTEQPMQPSAGQPTQPMGPDAGQPTQPMGSDAEQPMGAPPPVAAHETGVARTDDEHPMIVPIRAYYVARSADTLRSVAAQFLNSPARWEEVRALNAAYPGMAGLGPDELIPEGSALMLPGDPMPWGKPDPVYLWTLAERFLFTAWGRTPAPAEVVPFWKGLAMGTEIDEDALGDLGEIPGAAAALAPSPEPPLAEPAAAAQAPHDQPPDELAPQETAYADEADEAEPAEVEPAAEHRPEPSPAYADEPAAAPAPEPAAAPSPPAEPPPTDPAATAEPAAPPVAEPAAYSPPPPAEPAAEPAEPPVAEPAAYAHPAEPPAAYQPPPAEPAAEPPKYEPPTAEPAAYQPPPAEPAAEPPRYEPPTAEPAAYQPPPAEPAAEPPAYQPPVAEPSDAPPRYEPPAAAPPEPPAYQPPPEPPTYAPPTAEPPTYAPPTAEPPAYQPAAAEPSKPPAAEPPAYQPAAAAPPEPPTAEPPRYEPPTAEPAKPAAAPAEPPAYQPATATPAAAPPEPPAYQPPAAEPPTYEPPTAAPPAYQPPPAEPAEPPAYQPAAATPAAAPPEPPAYQPPAAEPPPAAPAYQPPPAAPAEPPAYQPPPEPPTYAPPTAEPPTYAPPTAYEPPSQPPTPDTPEPEPPAYYAEPETQQPYEEQEAPPLPQFMPSVTGPEVSAQQSMGELGVSQRSLGGTAIGDAMLLWRLSRMRQRRSGGAGRVRVPDPLVESLERNARMDSLRLIEAAMRQLRAVTVAQLKEKPKVMAVRVGTYGFEVLLDQPTAAPEGWQSASGGYVLELSEGVTLEQLDASGHGLSLCPALVPVGDTVEGPLLLNIEEIGCLMVSGTSIASASLLSAIVEALGSSPMASNIRVVTVGVNAPVGPGWERVLATSFDSPQLEQLLINASSPELASPGLDVLVVGPGHDVLIQRAGQIASSPRSNLTLVGATSSTAARWPWRIHVDEATRAVVQPIACTMVAAQAMSSELAASLSAEAADQLNNPPGF